MSVSLHAVISGYITLRARLISKLMINYRFSFIEIEETHGGDGAVPRGSKGQTVACC